MTIASMKQTGSSVRATARALGRSASTISRELTRNTCQDGPMRVLPNNIAAKTDACARGRWQIQMTEVEIEKFKNSLGPQHSEQFGYVVNSNW